MNTSFGFFELSAVPADGAGFGLFSPGHAVWLAVCAAAGAALCAGYRRADTAGRKRLRLAAACAALGIELLRALLLLLAGEYDIGRLPLHLCGLAVYAVFLHALRGGRTAGQFLYAFCLPGALAALLFPDWSSYPALHFMTASGFMLHTLIAAYVLMQTLGGDIVPDIRRAPACLGIMLLIALPVYAFDVLTGTNYMFLNWPSPGSPLEWFAFLGRPGYVLGYLPLIAAAWLVMYLPFRKKSAD